MIGIDTNLLLRHMLQDDPVQSLRASALLKRFCTSEDPGFVNRVVLCEMVWVMDRLYGSDKGVIGVALETLLSTAELEIENAEEAFQALEAWRGGADFSDALIATVNARAGCALTFTFDRKASLRAGMTLVT